MRSRIIAVAIIIIFLFLAAIIKAGMLQIRSGPALHGLARQQTFRGIEHIGNRGDILDRNGNILSTTVEVSSIFADPRRMSSPKKVIAELKRVLPLKETELAKRLQSERSFVWVLRRADPNVVNRVLSLGLPGISTVQEKRRFYPNHALLGQVLGLVSIDQNATGGVEKAREADLQKKVWSSETYVDAKGDFVRVENSPSPDELNGKNVVLTIDRNLQHVTEDILLKTVSRHRAKGGWAIVMQPQTGEILAMANVPLYNPNSPNMNFSRNQAISRAGEPGSIFKMVTFASAFENDIVGPEDLVDCENGKFDAGFMTITDVTKKKNITVQEAFKFSSNIGTFKIAQKIGPARLHKTMKRFGFGETSGLGLLEEAKGHIPAWESWGKRRFANVSFGYGFKASSLQMLLVAAAIANDGVMVFPKIFLDDLKKGSVRAISARGARLVKEIMFADTQEGGTGVRARIRGVDVAGKTGTAEKVDSETGKYSKKHNISSFVGFAPVLNPEIAAIVVIDEPEGIAYGGFVAAPAWSQIVSAALYIGSMKKTIRKANNIS